MIVMVSGGFDPVHEGHVRLILEAGKHGDVVVVLNSDAWLIRKKGFYFRSWEARREIMDGLKGVANVVPVDDSDGTVCEAIARVRPQAFVNGGDRGASNTPEVALCDDLGINLLWGAGGGKAASSSEIVARQWGFFEVLAARWNFKVKRLVVNPGKSLSLQRHSKRNEYWISLRDGAYQFIPAGAVHILRNDEREPLEVIEVQTGAYFGEDDIERIKT